jgi:hypothetical protein
MSNLHLHHQKKLFNNILLLISQNKTSYCINQCINNKIDVYLVLPVYRVVVYAAHKFVKYVASLKEAVVVALDVFNQVNFVVVAVYVALKMEHAVAVNIAVYHLVCADVA